MITPQEAQFLLASDLRTFRYCAQSLDFEKRALGLERNVIKLNHMFSGGVCTMASHYDQYDFLLSSTTMLCFPHYVSDLYIRLQTTYREEYQRTTAGAQRWLLVSGP